MKSDKPDRFKQNTDEARRQLDDVKRLTVKPSQPFTVSDLPPLPNDFETCGDFVEATREILVQLLARMMRASDIIEARVAIAQQINVLDHILAEADKRRG